ncbi:hypothetical protein Phi48:2_gp25 [Cellulophaga phage phi48:2]|nr:hypothetical protein Phi48:2_gp25 [Cellulophaga phage phi48:2]AGO47273.1 hypothetical protein Phi48:2_gp25 [Cellulophaga phage phi48:2]
MLNKKTEIMNTQKMLNVIVNVAATILIVACIIGIGFLFVELFNK